MKDTVAKSTKKAGSQSMASSARKPGVVKAVATALVKKIAGVLAPPAKAPPAKTTGKPAARPAKTAAKAAPAQPAARKAAAKPAAPAKTAPKTATPKAAPASKTVVKTAPKTATKTATQAAASKAGAPATAKQVPVVKAAAVRAVAAKQAAAPALKAKSVPAPKAAETGTKKTVAQQAVKAGETGARTEAVGGVTAELADKMKTSVVSKVSEVMTKTTKSTPAVNAEGRLISEDEIRAMNEKDYMNAAQLAFFKARLQQLEKDLLKNAGETTEHLRETVLVPDPADRATIEEEHALELRTRDRERKLLKKVQQSIAAIDAGDYGWCEETGEPIGIPRLIARPTATLSLEAQQRRELKQKLYGD
jgi:DnaK suppressor protein